MFNFLKSKKINQEATATNKTPADFKIGEVYKMKVASRSHVSKPYYIIIKDVGKDFIETDIPDKHSLKIEYPSLTWNYHIPRMILMMGEHEEVKKLIYNQKGLMPE